MCKSAPDVGCLRVSSSITLSPELRPHFEFREIEPVGLVVDGFLVVGKAVSKTSDRLLLSANDRNEIAELLNRLEYVSTGRTCVSLTHIY